MIEKQEKTFGLCGIIAFTLEPVLGREQLTKDMMLKKKDKTRRRYVMHFVLFVY